jgi:hypothetical protein
VVGCRGNLTIDAGCKEIFPINNTSVWQMILS